VLDSGGVTALLGHSQRARAWLRWIAERDGIVEVPVAVLVEIVTGDAGRDAEVNRVLDVLSRAGSGLSRPDEVTARRAGAHGRMTASMHSSPPPRSGTGLRVCS
jgi:hypothetical protein